MRIREATLDDAGAVADIYNYYIAQSIVTFETDARPASSIAARIEEARAASLPWLIADVGEEVAGYAYASRWNGRCAYRYSLESTIYVHPDRLRSGIGKPLYKALLARLQKGSTHVVIAGVSLPNPGSVALHEQLGFRKAGEFAEVGFKFDRWIDVGYWQLTFPKGNTDSNRAL